MRKNEAQPIQSIHLCDPIFLIHITLVYDYKAIGLSLEAEARQLYEFFSGVQVEFRVRVHKR